MCYLEEASISLSELGHMREGKVLNIFWIGYYYLTIKLFENGLYQTFSFIVNGHNTNNKIMERQRT